MLQGVKYLMRTYIVDNEVVKPVMVAGAPVVLPKFLMWGDMCGVVFCMAGARLAPLAHLCRWLTLSILCGFHRRGEAAFLWGPRQEAQLPFVRSTMSLVQIRHFVVALVNVRIHQHC